MASKNRGPKSSKSGRPAMKPDEFNQLLRAAVGVIAATHETRVGRMSPDDNQRMVASLILEIGGAHRLIPVLAAHCLTLAQTVADDNSVPIEDVITALGLKAANRF